jgi:phosphate transport system protein
MSLRPQYHYELGEVQRALLQMSDAVQAMIGAALRSLLRGEAATARRVIRDDDEIDERRVDLEERVLRLIAAQQPLATDLRFLLAVVRITDELERIGDYAEGIAKLSLQGESPITIDLPPDLHTLTTHVQAMLGRSVAAFIERDPSAAPQLEHDDDYADELNRALQATLLQLMETTPPLAPQALRLLFVTHNLERIADRAVNIAERAAFIATGRLPRQF